MQILFQDEIRSLLHLFIYFKKFTTGTLDFFKILFCVFCFLYVCFFSTFLNVPWMVAASVFPLHWSCWFCKIMRNFWITSLFYAEASKRGLLCLKYNCLMTISFSDFFSAVNKYLTNLTCINSLMVKVFENKISHHLSCITLY